MAYTYRFYRFASHTEFAAAWAEAGLPLGDDGTPTLSSGAIDEIGAVSIGDDPLTPVPGWHVNVAWAGAAPDALEAYAIEPFEGLHVFAGWSEPQPPAPSIRRIAPLAFRRRFGAKRATITLAAAQALSNGDPTLQAYLDDLNSAGFVDLDDPETITGMQALVAAGLLTEDEAAAMLADGTPEETEGLRT